MKFGKLTDISAVDFTLPPDAERTARVLARYSGVRTEAPKVYLGATGWSNKEWLGKWYPSKAKTEDFLTHYCRLFGTIELNTTHYRIPDLDLVQRWREQVGTQFEFCPKIPQLISHHSRLRAEEPTLRFAETIAGLGDKLGPCFIQLPDYHAPSELNLIHDFLKIWPKEVPLHWEFRHPDWFASEGGPMTEVFDTLEAAGHGTVVTDVAGRRDVLHMQLTNPVLVLRFIGNQWHPTDYERTDAWIARIAAWFEQGLHSAYIFIHQHDMDLVPEFTAYWADALNKRLGLKVIVPQRIPTSVQGTLF